MSSWSEGRRPLTLAILALGGEGGGVLADWIVATSERAGFHAQNTSVAGVAQRTGATVYYVEMLPPTNPTNGGPRPVRSEPVMSIFPTPGEVDVVIASELMESGRAIQRGFSTADRTTLITSTNRVYSIDEKVALGDGRVDDTKLLDGAQRGSKRLIAADFADLAERAGSVISASLFGALAGSAALPFTRDQFEDSIKASGKGVDASLVAFAAGFDVATTQAAPPKDASEEAVAGSQKVDPVTPRLIELPLSNGASSSGSTETTKAGAEAERNRIAATDPASLVGPGLRDLAEQVRGLPAAARSMILHGLVRTAVFQDRAYAERFLQRVRAFAAADPDPDGDARLTREAARHIALWMCYQDTIQVAAQKVRMRRMDRIRQEAKVRDNQLMQVREFLHPQIDEIVDTLPTWLGEPLSRSRTFRRIVRATTHKGMILNTNSVVGYTLLTTMALVRPLRPRSMRFVREQAAIEGWIAQALEAARTDPDLATEIIECQRVLKGYGSTWEHGNESFAVLMNAARRLLGTPGAAVRLADLREAALADEDGALLQAKAGALQPA